jgi:hypothetical protein
VHRLLWTVIGIPCLEMLAAGIPSLSSIVHEVSAKVPLRPVATADLLAGILQSLGCIPHSPSPTPDSNMILGRTEEMLRISKRQARETNLELMRVRVSSFLSFSSHRMLTGLRLNWPRSPPGVAAVASLTAMHLALQHWRLPLAHRSRAATEALSESPAPSRSRLIVLLSTVKLTLDLLACPRTPPPTVRAVRLHLCLIPQLQLESEGGKMMGRMIDLRALQRECRLPVKT